MSARSVLKTISVCGVLTMAGAALAQGTNAPQTQPPTLPPAAPGSSTTIPEKTPTSPGTDGATGNLSDKLDKSDGVIKPPSGIDPAMSKAAPATPQTMPVIKPPEEKGGPVAK